MQALEPWHMILAIIVLLVVIAVVVGIIVLVVFLVRRTGTPRPTVAQPPAQQTGPPPGASTSGPDPQALATLQRRLASGEITPEEFDRIRRHMEGESR